MPKNTPRTESAEPKKNGRAKSAPKTARDIVFPKYKAVWYVVDKSTVDGPAEGPITASLMKEWLGWEAETDNGPKFGDDYQLIDRYGKKVRLHNNIKNRPIYPAHYEELAQEVLRHRWKKNGETIIRGKTGVFLNGQHSGIGLVLADQDRVRHAKTYETVWPGECYIEKLVVSGVDEDDETVNTMDTCRPRSLSDVIYRSPYFAKLDNKSRSTASRVLDHAVRSMWRRTGVGEGAFRLRMSHPEAIDFINKHPKLMKCARHIMEANQKGGIGLYVGTGYASAACYLMASSDTNPDRYYGPEDHTEKPLNWDNWDKACEFWDEFGKPVKERTNEDGTVTPKSALAPLHEAIAKLTHEDGTPGSQSEKNYLVGQAWAAWKKKGKVAPKDLTIRYSDPDDKGRRHLIDVPTLGGIDLGLDFTVPKKPSDEPSDAEAVELQEDAEEVAHEGVNGRAESGNDWLWLDTLHREHPEVGPVFARSATGSWQAWGIDGGLVEKHVGLVPKMHPRGVECVTVKKEDIDGVVKELTKKGVTVGLAAEDEKGEWQMDSVHVPSKKK